MSGGAATGAEKAGVWSRFVAGARRRVVPGDRGAGTVLVLALTGTVVALTLGVAVLVGAAAARGSAQSAADLSALAAAGTVQSGGADPCRRAAQVAEQHGAVLLGCGCGADGSCSVEVSRSSRAGRAATAVARAGPRSAAPGGSPGT